MSHEHDHKGCPCCNGDMLDCIDEEGEDQSKRPILIFVMGIILVAIGYLTPSPISQIIFLIEVFFVGYGVMIHGIEELAHGKVKIELLVTIATFGAFLLGACEEGAVLMLLFYLGEYIEDYSLNASKKSIANIVKLTPQTAMVKHGDHEHEKPVKDLKIGDVVVVRPGDKIPIDGIIVKGQTTVNQSTITGESVPVAKEINDEVYESTINENGYIEIEVTKNPEDTIFAKIIELIKNSEQNKAKIDLFIDKFARVYTPIVVCLAIAVAVIPALLGYSIYEWTYRALTLLVISCPCALVISTPVSIVSAITKGTKSGVIIKGGEYIEALAGVKEILFDKTGTLTYGNLKISDIQSFSDLTDKEILRIACSIESQSNHPIANTFNEMDVDLLPVEDFETIPGKGVKGTINGVTYYVGKRTFFNTDVDSGEGTHVFVGTGKGALGLITLSDTVREESKSTISTLKKLDIRTAMISGDNDRTAKEVASEIGLNSYYGDLLPEDKVRIVEDSVKRYGDVAMVGDGINDTPSLAMANVGIAMGLEGADVAIETADIVLLEDKLSKIVSLVKLSRKTLGKIKFNVAFCLIVKVTLMVLGIAGYINLWEAILIGDMGITLIVVGNSLLLAK